MNVLNFMVSRVEHEKCFITSGPVESYKCKVLPLSKIILAYALYWLNTEEAAQVVECIFHYHA